MVRVGRSFRLVSHLRRLIQGNPLDPEPSEKFDHFLGRSALSPPELGIGVMGHHRYDGQPRFCRINLRISDPTRLLSTDTFRDATSEAVSDQEADRPKRWVAMRDLFHNERQAQGTPGRLEKLSDRGFDLLLDEVHLDFAHVSTSEAS